MPTIKATVTRIVSDTNFFFVPDDHGHRSIDLEGHRVGHGELSLECNPVELAKGNQSKIRPWKGKLPKVGDHVELQVSGPRGVPTDELEAPTEEEIQAEARRRIRASEIQRETEARVTAEMERLKGAPGGSTNG